VDEKSQIQALDRTAPVLPMLPGTPARASHDYVRAGTSSLYAALDLSTGKVIGSLHARHRAIEFKKFLQTLDREIPAGLDGHVVLDNASTTHQSLTDVLAIDCMDEQRVTAERHPGYARRPEPSLNPAGDLSEGARDAYELWPVQPALA
jgi:hypothetical protein